MVTGPAADPFDGPRPEDGSGLAPRVAKLAHGMGNELTAITGNLALAERHAAGNAKLIRLLDNMRLAAERCAHLTQELLTLAQDQGGAFLGDVAEEIPQLAYKRRVLIVEDDLLVAEVALAAMEDMGHLADHSENAASALEKLGSSVRFDLVFSDIVMPGGMSGIELAEIIAEKYPRVPVLLATGFSSAALQPDALRFPVLAKPYRIAELSRRVSQMLG